jgi:hypothetical protein
MGGITLLISFFFPPLWRSFPSGVFWILLSYYPTIAPLVAQLTRALCLFFPPIILIASMIWLWSRQMNRHPTIARAFLVTLEAIGIAFLTTLVFSVVLFVLLDNGGWYAATMFPMESGGWYAAALFSLLIGLALLVFSPCLLLASTLLAYLQRKAKRSNETAPIDVRSNLVL